MPIFSLDKVQFQFPGIILDLVVSNNILIVALEGIIQPSTSTSKDAANQIRPQKLLRIDLSQAHAIEGSCFMCGVSTNSVQTSALLSPMKVSN